ncbi:MAG: hypothetical protein HYZ34_03285 [Ignavibacteriae bacterium]|nr:hypothetical protein [Ignavibacteriota bacterium]
MKKLVTLSIAMVFIASMVIAQSIEEKLQKFGEGYAKGYLSPMFDAFGASLNSGWYSTANVDDGLSLFIGAKLMYLPIPDDGKKFSITSPYDGVLQEVPTAFGEEQEITISNTGYPDGPPNPPIPTPSPDKYPKGMNLGFVPMAMPHISIGNIYGTRVMIRYFPKTNVGDFGDFEMLGLGAQHSISKHLPSELPVDLAGMIAYQNLKLGTFFDATAFTFGAQASKSFSILDVYAGLAWETSSMSIGYDAKFTDPANPTGPPITKRIGFDAEGKNTVRLTGGIGLHLFIFKITADYSLAAQSAATLGIGLGW